MLDPLWGNIFRAKQKGPDGVIEFLRAVPLFADLSERELSVVEGLTYVRRYTDGEAIFKEGDPSLGMYIVKEGVVQILRHTAQGQKALIASLGTGDFFGELGLLDDAPRSATALAQGPTQAIGFFKPDLKRLLEQKPKLGTKIFLGVARTLCIRLRQTNEELKLLTSKLDVSVESGALVNAPLS